MDWSKYPNFSEDEFRCSHTGKCEIEPAFMDKMQSLRTKYGKAMTITSGYRHETHPIEARKERAGMHTKGIAADIACNGQEAYHIMKLAFDLGFTGIGVAQKGHSRFIHLDIFTKPPRANIWSY